MWYIFIVKMKIRFVIHTKKQMFLVKNHIKCVKKIPKRINIHLVYIIQPFLAN